MVWGVLVAIRQMGLEVASGEWQVASFVIGELEDVSIRPPLHDDHAQLAHTTPSYSPFKSKRHQRPILLFTIAVIFARTYKPSFCGAQFCVQDARQNEQRTSSSEQVPPIGSRGQHEVGGCFSGRWQNRDWCSNHKTMKGKMQTHMEQN